MKGKDIILELCTMGDTEGTGMTFTTPENTTELADWLSDQFGVDEDSCVEGTVELNTDYVYSYDVPFRNGTPDATVRVEDTSIYLYKVE